MLLRAGRGKSLAIAENPGKDRVTNTAPGVRGGDDFVDFVPETDVKTLQKLISFASCCCDSDTGQTDTRSLFLTLALALSDACWVEVPLLVPPGPLPGYPTCLLTCALAWFDPKQAQSEDVIHFISVLLQVHKLSVSLPFFPVPVAPSLSCLPSST